MAAPSALRRILRPPIVTRSFVVALVVGTLLNLINQGDALLGDGPVNGFKLALTYCVPFFVASFGAWSALASSDSNSQSG